MSSLSSTQPLPETALAGDAPDALLLEQFVAEQDELAFAALVERHGGLVRGVCRRILLDPAAADDAFQQTFWSLARQAPLLNESVTPTASLGSWLYRVAVNAALQQKRKAKSRRRTETSFAQTRPAAELPEEPWNDVLPVLDEEISALPRPYRSALVKCHLEGKTQQDAARELGITYATLRRRLKEARGLLRKRLSQRGFAHHGLLLVPVLDQIGQAAAPLSPAAVAAEATALGTSALSAGSAAATSAAISPAASISSLTTLGKLWLANLSIKSVLAGGLLLGVLGGWWILRGGSEPVPKPVKEQPAIVAASTSPKEAAASSTVIADQLALSADQEFLQESFPYAYSPATPVSPELESVWATLHAGDSPNGNASAADLPPLPPLLSSRELLKQVDELAPRRPEETDLLSGSDASGLGEGISVLSGPDFHALAASPVPVTPTANRDPLTVEQVMRFLNQEQARRTRPMEASPPGAHVLGQQAPEDKLHVEVIAFP